MEKQNKKKKKENAFIVYSVRVFSFFPPFIYLNAMKREWTTPQKVKAAIPKGKAEFIYPRTKLRLCFRILRRGASNNFYRTKRRRSYFPLYFTPTGGD